VYNLMDEVHVLYSPHPSHGHTTSAPPVESRAEILEAAFAYDPEHKVIWHETDIWNEGQQRDYAVNVLSQRGVQIITVLDYDEIYPYSTLKNILNYVWEINSARNHLLNFYGHFWRSFNYICKDENWPVRIIDTRHRDGIAYIPRELGPVYHFGYAITDKVMSYKLKIHGHRDELRPGWYEEKWQAWPPVEDCHPTNGRKENGEGWWNPEPFDRYLLPEFMYQHKWFNEEIIK
jgi:hypothetical protein